MTRAQKVALGAAATLLVCLGLALAVLVGLGTGSDADASRTGSAAGGGGADPVAIGSLELSTGARDEGGWATDVTLVFSGDDGVPARVAAAGSGDYDVRFARPVSMAPGVLEAVARPAERLLLDMRWDPSAAV